MYQIEAGQSVTNVATWPILEASCSPGFSKANRRGAPSELDDSSDISIAGSAASKAARDAATAKMGVLNQILGRKQEMV